MFSGQCPACGAGMHIRLWHCPDCHTEVRGDFFLSEFQNLTADDLDYLRVFLLSEGNFKLVEAQLGISYPTVKSRLRQLLDHLNYQVEEMSPTLAENAGQTDRPAVRALIQELLQQVRRGEISAADASIRIRELRDHQRT